MLWQICFFPEKGERNSPYDYISSLSDKKEQAKIAHRLQAIADLPVEQWPSAWIHQIEGKIFQLSAGKRSRLMYCLDDKSIIILHACKKVARKTLKKDIEIAIKNHENYINRKNRHE